MNKLIKYFKDTYKPTETMIDCDIDKQLWIKRIDDDSFIINGYMIHDFAVNEYAVYTPVQQLIEDPEELSNLDSPIFNNITNAILYCCGYLSEEILKNEPEVKEYLERELDNECKNDR